MKSVFTRPVFLGGFFGNCPNVLFLNYVHMHNVSELYQMVISNQIPLTYSFQSVSQISQMLVRILTKKAF